MKYDENGTVIEEISGTWDAENEKVVLSSKMMLIDGVKYYFTWDASKNAWVQDTAK